MLLFVDSEDVAGTMGKVTCRGHIGEQHEAACLVFPPSDALGIGMYRNMQSITERFDRARLAGAWPAPPIQRAFFHGYLEEMVGGGPGAERRRHGFRIRTAEILLLRGLPGDG